MTSVFILFDLAAKTLIMTSSSLAIFYLFLPDLLKRFKKIENEDSISMASKKSKPKYKKEGNLIVGNFGRRSINK